MEVLAEVVRSGFVEGRHHGVILRADPEGNVVWSVGDPDTVIFPRSANKPLQALGMLRAGLPLEGCLLALASASHSGEQFHLDAVREILTLAGLDESALQTPPGYPLDPHVHADYLRSGGTRAPICMDCSGKHAAMLLTCVINDWSTDTYLSPEHPLQKAIGDTFSDLTGGTPATVGIDGCGAPLLATSLACLTRAIGAIVQAPAGTEERRLVDAMVAFPEYLSGTTRDEMRLMRAFPGAIAKSGAEGVYVVGMPDGSVFALKIDDGADRARAVAMAKALTLAGHQHPILEEQPVILGGNRPVGLIRAVF
ncbi:MAG: asparaginase [Aeromicrobium sp.]